jgi:predicted MFS family arabinose efflux permease
VSSLDRDLKLLAAGNLLFALGAGMYLQLLFVYAMDLGASRFTIGVLNAVMLACIAAGNIPGAWASHRFPLKTVIVAVWWLTVPTAVCFALAPSWPWLIPGMVLSGLYMANNPAFKTYIALKSERERMARNITLVFGTYPAGLVVAPLLGGIIAEAWGMRTVFWLSTAFFAASSLTATLIGHVAYHSEQAQLRPAAVSRNRSFHRYVSFFLVGYLAVYVGQSFLTPYLSVVHDQSYGALGVFAALAALGAALLTPLSGRIADLRGPRVGTAVVLVLICAGTVLLLAGPSPLSWGAAMFLCGGYDTFRFLATGIVGRSFGEIPLAWGFAIFDATMGLPMAGGSLLGGALFGLGTSLPFVLVVAVSLALLAVLAIWRERADRSELETGR